MNLSTQTQSLFLHPKHNPDMKGNCSTCCGFICSSLTGDPPEQAMPPPGPAAMPLQGHCPSHLEGTAHGHSRTAQLGLQGLLLSLNTSPGSSQAPALILCPSGECQAPNVSHGTQDEVQLCPESRSFHTNFPVLSSTNTSPEPVGHSQFLESLK